MNVMYRLVLIRSDYRDIDPRYGTLEDWDRLVCGIHDRNMKIMYTAAHCIKS